MTPDGAISARQGMLTSWDPVSFFNGRFLANGVFIDRQKHIRRRFFADISADASDNQTVISESFSFDDGETEQRIWTLSRVSDTKIDAFTDDLAGRATGIVSGPVLHMRYDFFLTISGRRIKFAFDDIMICQDQNHLLNKARISKFGVFIGELIISFERI